MQLFTAANEQPVAMKHSVKIQKTWMG